LFGRKIAPLSDVKVGKTWNVRTMLKTEKLKNKRTDIKSIDTYIYKGIFNIRWSDNDYFWSEEGKVIR